MEQVITTKECIGCLTSTCIRKTGVRRGRSYLLSLSIHLVFV